MSKKPIEAEIQPDTAIPQVPRFANEVVAGQAAEAREIADRFDRGVEATPTLLRRIFASAEDRRVSEFRRACAEAEGNSRLERLRIHHHAQLRILGAVAEALVKANEVSISRGFYEHVQNELTILSTTTERHRVEFMKHIMQREETLKTLSPRLQRRYDDSIEREIDSHLDWF